MAPSTPELYSTSITDRELRLTAAAKAKLAELFREAGPELDAVRLFVAGGGCGGMSYGMTFSEETTGYDSVLQDGDFRLVVDAVALNYLKGCEIDFAEDSFVFSDVFQSLGGSGACGGCGGGRGF